jgi:hypothetical protein
MGERICFAVATDTAAAFINFSTQDGVCKEALYTAALNAIIVILDGVGNVQTDGESGKSDSISKAKFDSQMQTIVQDLTFRRAKIDAYLETLGGETRQ